MTNVESPSRYPTSHEMLISNLSLPLPVQMAGGLETVNKYSESIGAGGIELTPSKHGRLMGQLHKRIRAMDATQNEGEPTYPANILASAGIVGMYYVELNTRRDWTETDELLRSTVRSYHSSPRDAEAPKFDLLGRIVFPHYKDSLYLAHRLQEITGPRPGVVFPYFDDKKVTYDPTALTFSSLRFQPKPKDWQRMGIPEREVGLDVHVALLRDGLSEIAWDVFHARNEQDGARFDSPMELCRQLGELGLIGSVHVSLDRQDCAPKGSYISELTRRAKSAFVESEKAAMRTMEGRMLSQVAGEWKRRPSTTQRSVVVETLPGVSTRTAAYEHAKIIEHAQLIMENA